MISVVRILRFLGFVLVFRKVMISANVFACIVLVLASVLSLSNAATLPATANTTTESTALAKTSSTIMDVFEDVRWFFERLGIFCDMLEKMLPPERKEREQPQQSLGLSLQTGLRHFIFGVREISKSIVRVLSDKDVREYKQLSRATDFAHDLVKSVAEFFRDLRKFVGDLFAAYTFYVPEVMLSKCLGNYLLVTYPDRPMYEFPILLINDIIDAFRTPVTFDGSNNMTESVRKLGHGSEINYDKNVEQNEILDDDMYVFHNTPVSPTPELTVKNKENTVENDTASGLKEHFDLIEKLEGEMMDVPSWKKCVQLYATETIFRKLEFYFLEMKG